MTHANPWPQAAQRLAQRVNARALRSAVLERVGPAVFAGGVGGVAARLLGAPQSAVPVCLSAGLLVGALLGWRRASAVTAVSPGAAAWALDRVAERGEHGLAAAVGSEAVAQAAAQVAAAPPKVRMLAPQGLAWVAAGLLAAAVAWMAPLPDDPKEGAVPGARAPAGTQARTPGTATGPGGAAAGLAEVAKVREALNLPPDGALNREAVAKRFADPAAKNRALKAAGSGSVAERLQSDDSSPEALAQALLDADAAARAAAVGQRRQEAEAYARASLHGGAIARVPAHRRGVVKRYLERLAK